MHDADPIGQSFVSMAAHFAVGQVSDFTRVQTLSPRVSGAVGECLEADSCSDL